MSYNNKKHYNCLFSTSFLLFDNNNIDLVLEWFLGHLGILIILNPWI